MVEAVNAQLVVVDRKPLVEVQPEPKKTEVKNVKSNNEVDIRV
tara:strand:+ start:135 stop:263 length:129 start_codon:yes stop_codon:yes gene_type:complete